VLRPLVQLNRLTQQRPTARLQIMKKKYTHSTQQSKATLKPSGKFRFIRQDCIGAADAEDDQAFLKECFVDNGDLNVLRDMDDPKRIVLGRTGSGKTALLTRLAEEESRVIQINPESLALTAISNSKLLNFSLQLGVNLDVFFKLLWRHVFTVEVLRQHFHIKNETEKNRFLEKIRNFFSSDNRETEKMMAFLESWGRSYWKDTEYRVKEIASNFESELKATLGSTIDPFYINIENVDLMPSEQRSDSIERVHQVLNQVHAKQLSEVITQLGKVLVKDKVNYYITIDRLDEGWIDEKLRYLLIRALLETIKEFRRTKHVKIIVALRYDLLTRVFRNTRDVSGFQEEKYESLNLHLDWTWERLIELLDKRIDFLVKKRNPKRIVTHYDVLPPVIGRKDAIDYLIERTLMRPRDVIHFFNYCIRQAEGRAKLTIDMIRHAEGEYSRARLDFLFDEWKANYPNLEKGTRLLKKKPPVFALNELSADDCEEFCLNMSVDDRCKTDSISEEACRFMESKCLLDDFRKSIVKVFYIVGLVGLKLETYEAVMYSFSGRRIISESEITNETRIHIHPCFWRALGIQEQMEGYKAAQQH